MSTSSNPSASLDMPHGLPGTSSCNTPYIQLGCQQPDVRVLPIQVPA